jgi:hypothetical protein
MQAACSSLQVEHRNKRQNTADTEQAVFTLQHSTRLQQLLQLQVERRAAARKQRAGQRDNEVSDTKSRNCSAVHNLIFNVLRVHASVVCSSCMSGQLECCHTLPLQRAC